MQYYSHYGKDCWREWVPCAAMASSRTNKNTQSRAESGTSAPDAQFIRRTITQMESNPNINTNENLENEMNDEAFDSVEELEANEAAETDDRPQGRGRGRGHRGPGGRRPFGPNRPYRFALFAEEDGSFVLRSPDLTERSATIESLDELGATMQAAIAERAAEDAAAAEAAKDGDYSGKFVLRLPKSMHRQLAELAETEGVSLNQLALAYLAEGMGKAEVAEDFGKRRGHRGGPRGGHGSGGRGPWGYGPRGGRDRGSEDHGPGRNLSGRVDCKERGRRGRHGFDPEHYGPEGHGPGARDFRRSRWFMSETLGSNADSAEHNELSFV
jgi:antitoxin HicB